METAARGKCNGASASRAEGTVPLYAQRVSFVRVLEVLPLRHSDEGLTRITENHKMAARLRGRPARKSSKRLDIHDAG